MTSLASLLLMLAASLLFSACGGGGGGGKSGARITELENPPLLYATVDIPYQYQIIAYGSPAPTVRLTGLPDWLTYENGIVSGTPTAAEIGVSEEIRLHAFNGVTRDEIHIFTIEVAGPSGAPAAPSITSSPVTTARTGEEYTYAITGVGNPRPTFSAKGLPNWLSVVDGTITGIPPEEALNRRYAIEVRARNGVEPMARQVYTLTVEQGNIPEMPEFRVLQPSPVGELTLGMSSTATVTVSLGIPAAVDTMVDYATVDGTATAGADYTATSGTLTFLAGEITKQVMIEILGDDLAEGNETFALMLSNAVGAPIGVASNNVTIADDDVVSGIPEVSVNAPTSTFEGNVGMTSVNFSIELSQMGTSDVTVMYATSDLTATAGVDYNSVSGMLTFTPGETVKQVAVQILGDTDVESDETFQMALSQAQGATIVGVTSTYTILEDDSAMLVMTCGSGADGRQGNGSTNDQLNPAVVQTAGAMDLQSASQVVMGNGFGLALLTDGTVWGWGKNDLGQTGTGSANPTVDGAMQVVDGASQPLVGIVEIAAGSAHAIARTATGSIYAWGSNDSGQLGNDTVAVSTTTAVQVLTMSGGSALTGVSSIAAGGLHNAAVLNTGTTVAWGANDNFQLGAMSINLSEPFPVDMVESSGTPLSGISQVACGATHTVVVTAGGDAWACGDNSFGQLGDNSMTGRDHLMRVLDNMLNNLVGVALVAAGEHTSFFVMNNGGLLSCGANSAGQLGDASMMDRMLPVAVRDFNSTPLANIVDVAAGRDHAVAINSNGDIYAWGNNDNGELGSGTMSATTVARSIRDGMGNPIRGQSVSAGADATILVK